MKNLDDIAREVAKLLLDADDCNPDYDFTRWSRNDLKHYAVDGIIMIASLMPDRFSEWKTIALRPGRIQYIPEECETLLKIIGVHGSVDADSPIASTANERLSGIFPSRCSTPLNARDYKLQDYTIETKSKRLFYVSPPVPADGEVLLDVICASIPTVDEDYKVPSWAHNLLVEWMLYRAHLAQEETEGAETTAANHLGYFYSMLNNMTRADEKISGKAEVRNNGAIEAN